MPPLAWAAVGAYLVATLVSRMPGQRERHGLRAGWWWLGMFALAVHLVVHYGRWQALGGVDLHFFAALSLVTAAMSAITLLLGVNRDSSLLAIVAFPIAALMLGLYALLGKPVPTPATQDWRITLHAAIALLAYATLNIAALVAIVLFVQERALRARRLGDWMHRFPPLALVERLLFQLIGIGFALLTATLLTGVLFVENLFAQHLVHKTVLSIAAWLVFGTLLYGRWRWGWRGRRAVNFTLAGMLLLVLGFVGSKFVLELVLQRPA